MFLLHKGVLLDEQLAGAQTITVHEGGNSWSDIADED